MTTPHKWADVIKAWADGKPIERRFMADKWREITGYGTPPFDDARNEWRIKPETVKCRRYIWQSSDGKTRVGIVDSFSNVVYTDNYPNVIRWIDDDWQEIEV